MSSKRPGTVDYSKWDHIECSDSESEDDGKPSPFFHGGEQEDDDSEYESSEESESGEEEDGDSESESSEESEGDEEEDDSDGSDEEDDATQPPSQTRRNNAVNRRAPVVAAAPTLAALQRAWNTEHSDVTRHQCANCFSPNAPRSCSRCKLMWYCDATCQLGYHPIHKLECIDAGKHATFWGIFDKKKSDGDEGTTNLVTLRARRLSKRREY